MSTSVKHSLSDITDAPGPAKAPRVSESTGAIPLAKLLSLNSATLQAADKDTLIRYVTDLQASCKRFQADKAKRVLAEKTADGRRGQCERQS